MNKKGEFNLQTYIVVLLLGMGLLATLSGLVGSMAEDYSALSNVTLNTTDFDATYNKIDLITTPLSDESDKMRAASLGDESSTVTQYSSAVNIVKIIWGTASLPFAMLTDMQERLHIPTLWTTVINAILITMLITTFVFMIFQSRG